MPLKEIRVKIEKIDTHILDLIEQRTIALSSYRR